MSFDLTKVEDDEEFWAKLVQGHRAKLLEHGWKSPLLPGHLGEDENWDALDNLLNEIIESEGQEVAFSESDGGGIPGSADFAMITEFLGKYFVTGSYLIGGPYDTCQEAADEAGI
ncbi:hypothetical protein N9F61_00020 [Akkermansiaceae bacterium]|nr:hypothetical protein [Akkermansiaceae bacterium]